MKKWISSSTVQLIFAFILGIACGFIPSCKVVADPVAGLFIKTLQLIGVPLLFLSLTSTISGMENWKQMRVMGRKVLKYTLLTTIIAALVALGMYVLLNPAQQSAHTISYTDLEAPQSQGNYLAVVFDMFPSNIFGAFVENNVMGVVIIAFFLGFGALTLKKEEKHLAHQVFSTFLNIMMKVTIVIVKLMPIGVWAFMVQLVQSFSNQSLLLDQLGIYFLCVIIANLVQAFIVLPLILKIRGLPAFPTMKAMLPALAMAASTRSSNATLPITLRCAEEGLKIPRKVSRFSLPLCSTINMNGCAGFIVITVLFVSMLNGVYFSPFSMLLWVLLASIAAVGNAGVPMGCYFLASAFLNSLGVPLAIMGLILPLYTLIDMVETAVNIWSDSCVTALVSKELEEADTPT